WRMHAVVVGDEDERCGHASNLEIIRQRDVHGRAAPHGRDPEKTREKQSPGSESGAWIKHENALVGMAGFEPTTTCTPSRCATRTLYTPTRRRRSDPSSIIPLQEIQYFAELLAHRAERLHAPRARLRRGRRLARRQRSDRAAGHLRLQFLLRARDREPLF